ASSASAINRSAFWRRSAAAEPVLDRLRSPIYYRLDPYALLAGSRRKCPRRHERHVALPCWIRRLDRPRPDPRDRRQLLPIRAGHVRIEVPDPLVRFVAHPPAVRLDVRGQTLRPVPRPELVSLLGMDRRASGEARRDLDHRLL